MTSKRMRFVALLTLAVAPFATPATAEEALVDGVRFVVPDGTGFFLPPPHGGIVRGPDVQAVLDKNRAAGPGREGAGILFTSLALPDKPVVAVLVEPPASHPFSVRRSRMRDLARTDGVASVPPGLAPEGEPPARLYYVATGLDYAPDAVVACEPQKNGSERCRMSLTLDGRLRMALVGFTLDESTPASLREGVVAAVAKTLPEGMRKH